MARAFIPTSSPKDRGRAMHGIEAVDPFIFRLSIFVLAVFVGYFVVWSVTSALHTPLMSVTNAISSFLVVPQCLAMYQKKKKLRGNASDQHGFLGRAIMNANLAALLYLVGGTLFIL